MTTPKPHPTIETAAGQLVQLIGHKRNPYDRGTKKILVDHAHWGWIFTEWHGVWGTSYHLHDMIGTVTKPAKEDDPGRSRVEIKAISRKKAIGNNEKTDASMTPDGIMLTMVQRAIEQGWLRSPTTRTKEATEINAKVEAARATASEQRKTEWNDRINQVLQLGFGIGDSSRVEFDTVILRDAIHAAMTWAQTR